MRGRGLIPPARVDWPWRWSAIARVRSRLPWPLPALLTWAAAWAAYAALRSHGMVAFVAACLLGVALACVAAPSRWRRLIAALGFPLSLAASGAGSALPAWGWLVPLGWLALLYPLRTWRDAPLFPTPAGALAQLAAAAPLPPGAGLLDAGCGLGAGLVELHRAYPATRPLGIEWSWPLALLCRWRCRRFATVRRGDIWTADWSAHSMVYLFQRPESMVRAWQKAQCEMRPGTWLVSLEFEIAGVRPACRLSGIGGRPVWVYRLGSSSAAEVRARRAGGRLGSHPRSA